jgi:hypothetical protein
VIAASDLIRNLPATTGIPESTVRGHYRKLNESGILPASHGAKVVKLNSHHVVMLLLAILPDVQAKDAVRTACVYHDLKDAHGNNFGDVLVNMLDSFRSANEVSGLTYKSRVELDCKTPRVCITSDCNDGMSIETLYGVQTKQWSDVRVRRSVTISGKVLFELAKGIHFNRWPDNQKDF